MIVKPVHEARSAMLLADSRAGSLEDRHLECVQDTGVVHLSYGDLTTIPPTIISKKH